MPDLKQLLAAAVRRDFVGLGVELGVSPTRLAQLTLQAIDDPQVQAAFPRECGVLRRRREQDRARRAPWGT